MRSLRHLQLVGVMIVLAVASLVIGPRPALAAVSAGCAAANFNAANFSSFTMNLFAFIQGETVSLSISGGTAAASSIVVNGTTVASGGNPSVIFFTFPASQVFTTVRFEADPQPGALAASFTIACPVTPPASAAASAPCPFTDGRLNACDAAENVAVYCAAGGSVSVWAIDNGKGYPAFTASPAEIAKVPLHPPQNTLIKENFGARLYRLTTGEL